MRSLRTLALFPFFALLVLAAVDVASAANAAAKEEGKFHLVYLVSTDKVEVGAKAYVEPLFFTDGNRLVFAYDYCRQYYQRKHGKPETAYPGILIRKEDLIYPNQIASDLKGIHSYCEGQDTKIDFSSYIVRDTSGVSLKIGNVEFPRQIVFDGLAPGMVQPPVFPDRGTAAIRAVQGNPVLNPETTIEGGQQYFYLASETTSMLDRIAPMQKIKPEEIAVLKKQIRDYAQRRVGAPKDLDKFDECELGNIVDRTGKSVPWKGPAHLERVQLIAGTIADLDRDHRSDAIISLRNEAVMGGVTDPVPGFSTATLFPTTEVRLVYGSGKSRCFLWRPGTAKGSFPIRLPLAFVWVGGKGYLITTQSDVIDNQSFDVVSVVPPDPAKRVLPGSGFKYVIPR